MGMKKGLWLTSALVVLGACVLAGAAELVNVADANKGATIKATWQQKIEDKWVDKGPMAVSNSYLIRGALISMIDGIFAGEPYFGTDPNNSAEKRYCFEIKLAAPSTLKRIAVYTLGAEGSSDAVRHAKSVWIQALVDGEWTDVVGTEASPVPAKGKDYVRLAYDVNVPGVASKVRVWLYGRLTPIPGQENKLFGACPRVQEIMIFGEPSEPIKSLGGDIIEKDDGSCEMNLNGMWLIRPQDPKAEVGETPKGSWGWCIVPCSWKDEKAVTPGWGGNAWKEPIATARRVWLLRRLQVPKSWKGRRLTLAVDGLTSAAEIYVNDEKVGTVEGPAGRLDVTNFIQAGKNLRIGILVYAGDKPYAFWSEAPDGPVPDGAGIKGKVTLIAK